MFSDPLLSVKNSPLTGVKYEEEISEIKEKLE